MLSSLEILKAFRINIYARVKIPSFISSSSTSFSGYREVSNERFYSEVFQKLSCNLKKGDRTPDEAGMPLRFSAKVPNLLSSDLYTSKIWIEYKESF